MTFTVLVAAVLFKAPSFTCQVMVRLVSVPKLVGLSLVEEKVIDAQRRLVVGHRALPVRVSTPVPLS